jgi:plasmid replication initiation protein
MPFDLRCYLDMCKSYKSFDISEEVIRELPFYELVKEGN